MLQVVTYNTTIEVTSNQTVKKTTYSKNSYNCNHNYTGNETPPTDFWIY